ncbi:hypothetical protein STHU_40630 [Allostella humosa]|uniref:hypothetical protein n=1 Tax=Stella humosa TaxID=94 RepID=UPI00113E9D95|nr:hypothetical protein [Stella humosa]BBK33429.1 hypothetical protein STHU_40630 [Stella humosa]
MSWRLGSAAIAVTMLAVTPAGAVNYSIAFLLVNNTDWTANFAISSTFGSQTGSMFARRQTPVAYTYPLTEGLTPPDGEIRVEITDPNGKYCDAKVRVTFSTTAVSNVVSCSIGTYSGCNGVGFGGGGASLNKAMAPPVCEFGVTL